MVYISSYKTNFYSLQLITPKAIKGTRGLSIAVYEVRSIRLSTAKGKLLMLEKALYISNSTVYLINICQLHLSRQLNLLMLG